MDANEARQDYCSGNICQRCLGSGFSIDDKKAGRALARLRESAGLSMTAVAKHMGITVQFLNALEKGRRGWTSKNIEKYVTICTRAE
jgi:DNA-binding XRE family transcriptional regulator